MAHPTQETRHIEVHTPLGEDVLLLTRFEGREELSRLFRFRLDMESEEEAIAPADIVGKAVTFLLKPPDTEGEPRYFNGIVSRFICAGANDRDFTIYHADVVPWLWLLTRTSDCRIFQHKSVPEIIDEVLEEHAGRYEFAEFDDSGMTGHHPEREYCVQYRETDFDFLSRLMEEEGIFYYFTHEDGKHTLVLADSIGAYQHDEPIEVAFASHVGSRHLGQEIERWEHSYEYRSGKWAQRDFNFRNPDPDDLTTSTSTKFSLNGNVDFEQYEYPGGYPERDDGDELVKIRMEEEEAGYDVVVGRGFRRDFAPGTVFTMAEHHSQAEKDRKYVLTDVYHKAAGAAYTTAGSVEEKELEYENAFTCIPDDVVFRPARTTPKPLVHGAQTALVVGPEGEEIYTDEYGRVKVQFHWDRYGEADEDSSCWVRVAQLWAGNKWGAIFLPRIGQEVMVDFLEGDPDRPIITGRVYNGENMPPYPLPDEKTRSTIKSHSTKDASGFNEIRFEDKTGEEQIFIHAEKDEDHRVKNDTREWVGNDRHLIVKNNQQELVEQNKHLHVKGNHEEKIDGSMKLTVGEGGEVQEILIKGDRLDRVESNQHQDIGGDRVEQVGGDQSLTVGGSVDASVGSKHAVEAGQEIHLKAGMKVILEAGTQLSIKGPGGFVSIDASGVTIQGNMVKINSGGAAGSGSGASPASPQSASNAEPAEPAEAEEGQTP